MKNMIAFFIIAVAMIAFTSCAPECTYDKKLNACVEDLPDDVTMPDNATKPDNAVTDTDTAKPGKGEEGGECLETSDGFECLKGLECVIDGDLKVCRKAVVNDDDTPDNGEEGGPCIETSEGVYECETGLECVEEGSDKICRKPASDDVVSDEDNVVSDADTGDPDAGKENHVCRTAEPRCDDGLYCDTTTGASYDICKPKNEIADGELGAKCSKASDCESGICDTPTSECINEPSNGTRAMCWVMDVNGGEDQGEPSVDDACSVQTTDAQAYSADAAWEQSTTAQKTPACCTAYTVDGCVHSTTVYPTAIECCRTDMSAAAFVECGVGRTYDEMLACRKCVSNAYQKEVNK